MPDGTEQVLPGREGEKEDDHPDQQTRGSHKNPSQRPTHDGRKGPHSPGPETRRMDHRLRPDLHNWLRRQEGYQAEDHSCHDEDTEVEDLDPVRPEFPRHLSGLSDQGPHDGSDDPSDGDDRGRPRQPEPEPGLVSEPHPGRTHSYDQEDERPGEVVNASYQVMDKQVGPDPG